MLIVWSNSSQMTIQSFLVVALKLLMMGTQPYGFMVSYSKKIKELVSIPVSVVGRIVTPEAAEAVITNGSADIIGLGRSLLTDPDFANKCADGHCCNVRTCMMCNKGCTEIFRIVLS